MLRIRRITAVLLRPFGKQKDAQLHISEEPIVGFKYSETDIIRLIYQRLITEELVKQIRLETLIVDDGKKEVCIAVTYRFGDTMAWCKIYPSAQSLPEDLKDQEGLLLKTS